MAGESDVLLAHVERYLGTVVRGAKLRDSVQVAECKGPPIRDCAAFVTLGLSRHLLSTQDGATIKLELLMLARRTSALYQHCAPLLAAVVDVILNAHVAPEPGALFRTGLASAPYLFMSGPAYIDPDFLQLKLDDRTCLFPWLIPIFEAEAEFVRREGWEQFEQRLQDVNPDLLLIERDSTIALDV